jgi:hypothetical protein
MAKTPDTLTHPILGVLTWESPQWWWFTRYELSDGGALDVMIDPARRDRRAFLKRAADLFLWALVNERRVRREAVEAELLELCNDPGVREEEPAMSAEELEAALNWRGLTISEGEDVLVDFGYDPSELFGAHRVHVELDDGLKFLGVDLRG